MRIEAQSNLENPAKWIDAVSKLWREHPFRSIAIEQECASAILLIDQNDEYVTDWNEYPIIRLKIRTADNLPHSAILTHELTHIIDRHDIIFSEGNSPIELSELIEKLPVDVNELIRTAFRIMWDMYIDGRLSRRSIIVETFDQRLDEFLGSRKNRIPIDPNEKYALQTIWEKEPQTISELIGVATLFPVKRPPSFRIPPQGG